MSAELDRLRAVTHAQHAELLALRAGAARVREVCAAHARGSTSTIVDVCAEVLAALGDPGRP